MSQRWGAGGVRAHELTAHPHVDVPIIAVLLGAFVLVVLISTLVAPRADPPGETTRSVASPMPTSWDGRLSPPQLITRTLAVGVLLLTVLAGRLGADDELENLAPALVVGAGWPLLLLACSLLPQLWRWVDPWDAIARLVVRGTSRPGDHVYPAALVALPLGWFLAVHPTPLDPRDVGFAVAAYTVATLAGCLAWGRERWLSTAEPVGLVLTWVGRLPRRAHAGWPPPRGAAAVLGVGIGGMLFGAVRRTEYWSGVLLSEHPLWWSTLTYAAFCAALGAAAEAACRDRTRGAAVVRALAPVFVGVSLAFALARDRLFTSVQLLPGLIGDPFGQGWDLFGAPTDGLRVSPLGAVALVTLQLGLVIATHLYAAASAPRTLVGDDRIPVIATLGLSVALAVTAMSLH